MNITLVGTGYVGLVTGACLAELGNDVVCLDRDQEKVDALARGQIHIHEPGLESLVARNVAARRLRFTSDPADAIAHGTVQFIAVGTPADGDGGADLSQVLEAARNIGRHMKGHVIVVDKSTVPVGTADRVRAAVQEELARRGEDHAFSVVSNPEFLKEGAAVADFMRPDRIVVGADDERAVEIMRAIYSAILRNHDRMIVMDVRSAELTKYAANAMLATRISFMNEIANLAEKVGADVEKVRHGIGSDSRIGFNFLYAGCGYGGSCFPKDIAALQKTALEFDGAMEILEAVRRVNNRQKQRLLHKVRDRFGQALDGARIAVWGLAFKPNTNDMREAPSRVVIDGLVVRGARVTAYDPIAMPEARKIYAGEPLVRFAESPMAALDGADALVIVTEWKEFRSPDFPEMARRMKRPVVFDGRNLYEPALMRSFGIEYHAIGRPDATIAPSTSTTAKDEGAEYKTAVGGR
jgi:UDPglucose 6-dehydrogenase